MPKSHVILMSKRRLLLGTAACIAVGLFPPVTFDANDSLLIQDGWLLKKADLL